MGTTGTPTRRQQPLRVGRGHDLMGRGDRITTRTGTLNGARRLTVSLLSPPAQLAQAVVVDAEVMGHLVHDGNPYLAA